MKTKTTAFKPNKRLFRRVQRFIKAEPRRLDMNDWSRGVETRDTTRPWSPPCRTTSCIAGTALLLNGWTVGRMRKAENKTIYHRAEKLLGLPLTKFNKTNFDFWGSETADQTSIGHRLFLVDSWPKQFRARYQKATTKLYSLRSQYLQFNYEGKQDSSNQKALVPKILRLQETQARLACQRIDLLLDKGI